MLVKQYLKVCAIFTQDGHIIPKSFLYSDGHIYKIERVIRVENRCASKTGGSGIKYCVSIQGCIRDLFLDDNRWYIETKKEK